MKGKVKVPAGLDTEVYRADDGERPRRDRPVPGLGDADDVRHDHRLGAEADGRQVDAGGIRCRSPERLPKFHKGGGGADETPAPSAAALAPRRPGVAEAPPGEPRRVGYVYLLPALGVYAAFVLWPLGRTVWLSLHQWDGLTPATWVGLDNYREIVESGPLRSAFVHSLVLILFYAVIPVTLGLVLVGALSRAELRGQAVFRTVLFLPLVIPMVVVAVIWRMIYEPQDGSLNELLRAVGPDR